MSNPRPLECGPMGHTFRFSVLGRYPARLKEGQTAVTVNLAAGEEGHLVYCGTLTMDETEWDTLVAALEKSLKGALVVDDHSRA